MKDEDMKEVVYHLIVLLINAKELYAVSYQNFKNLTNVTGPKYRLVADGLYVQNVTLEDEGNYSCQAYQLSNTTSNLVVRTVMVKIKREYGCTLKHSLVQ